jgi:RNA polymerase sigma factor (sigma-70 family)
LTLDQIISGAQKNNITAQSHLYQMFATKFFGVCLKYSRNHQEAQDNLQDGFLLIFDKIKKFDNKGSFEGWAKKVIINHVLQQYRKSTFLEIVTDDIPHQEDVELETDQVSMDFLLQIIQELPDRYRLVFNLYAIDDYSHKEIAEQLDISVGTSKSNLSRARNILKQKIKALQTNKISVK